MRRKPEAQASHAQPEPPPCQTTKTIDLLTRTSKLLETGLWNSHGIFIYPDANWYPRTRLGGQDCLWLDLAVVAGCQSDRWMGCLMTQLRIQSLSGVSRLQIED